jgi:hypothetical protein
VLLATDETLNPITGREDLGLAREGAIRDVRRAFDAVLESGS